MQLDSSSDADNQLDSLVACSRDMRRQPPDPAEIQRTIERAQADKPPLARLADRVAAHFVAIVLLIVSGVAAFW